MPSAGKPIVLFLWSISLFVLQLLDYVSADTCGLLRFDFPTLLTLRLQDKGNPRHCLNALSGTGKCLLVAMQTEL